MSINSLTNIEMQRQRPQPPQDTAFEAQLVPAEGASSAVTVPIDTSQVGNALDLLIKYIPTEMITLYVAGMSAVLTLQSAAKIAPIVYWAGGILTPILLVLVLMNKRASAGQGPIPDRWPWWRMVAATVAFLVWALAVPGNPYVTTDALHVLAGFGAIFVSTILSLLDPIFVRPAVT